MVDKSCKAQWKGTCAQMEGIISFFELIIYLFKSNFKKIPAI